MGRARADEPVEIDGAFHRIGEALQPCVELLGLAGLDEAEMALGQGEVGIAHERAEHRQPDAGHAVLDQPAMALARDLVQHHAGDRDARIVPGAAERDGGGRLRVARHVEHENHRPAEQGGDVGAGSRAADLLADAVEEAHGAFGDDEIGLARQPRRRWRRGGAWSWRSCRG